MSGILFALGQYAQLFIFLVACWGWGRTIVRWPDTTEATRNPVSVVIGIGVMICTLQALAIWGNLNRSVVVALIASGLCLTAVNWFHLRSYRLGIAPNESDRRQRSRPEQLILALLFLYGIPLAIAPLGVPLAWDELMYHLPHAREWAQSGSLQVNEWIRYPWFPYNFDLLFAAALTLDNDVQPHLLHAATGGITSWLIYRLGVQHLHDHITAGLAALIWLVLSRSLYGWAYVDMSVAMFILAACVAMQEWHASGASASTRSRGWIFACAFMVGVAAGIKYQVLALLPLFALVLVWHDRRPSTWLGVVAFLCLPCLYWYARNAMMTGDPFNPVGGKIFGFTDWNADDYRGQFEVLRRNAGWPHWTLWPALLIPLVPTLRKNKMLRQTFLVSAYMVLVWVATSRYPRYLMFAFPLLALLAAASSAFVLRKMGEWLGMSRPRQVVILSILGGALLIITAISSAYSVKKHWTNIGSTDASREKILAERVSGYGVWKYLQSHPQAKVYQFGLEDAIYYAPHPIWGEVFGPWRYRDYDGLSSEQLFAKLTKEKFTAIVIHTERVPHITLRPNFDQYFELLHQDSNVKLYRLKPAPSVHPITHNS